MYALRAINVRVFVYDSRVISATYTPEQITARASACAVRPPKSAHARGGLELEAPVLQYRRRFPVRPACAGSAGGRG